MDSARPAPRASSSSSSRSSSSQRSSTTTRSSTAGSSRPGNSSSQRAVGSSQGRDGSRISREARSGERAGRTPQFERSFGQKGPVGDQRQGAQGNSGGQAGSAGRGGAPATGAPSTPGHFHDPQARALETFAASPDSAAGRHDRESAELGMTAPVPQTEAFSREGHRTWTPGPGVGAGGATGPWTEHRSSQGQLNRQAPDGTSEARLGSNHWSSPTGGTDAVRRDTERQGSRVITPGAAPEDTAAGRHDREFARESGDPGAQIRVAGQISPQEQETLQRSLEAIPSEARRFLGDIHVAPDLGRVHGPQGGPVAGLAGTDRVFLERDQLSSEVATRGTLTHELGHNADARSGRPSSLPTFAQGTPAVTPYGDTNPLERYAETSRALLENLDRYQGGQSPSPGSPLRGDYEPTVAPGRDQASRVLQDLGVDPNRYWVAPPRS